MIKLSKSVLAKAVAVACAAGMLSACSASAQNTAAIDDSQLYVRQAAGDITKFAGARRIQDNQTELYSNVLDLAKKEHARNVILLIGDGMGDSEITAARNFAHGAGGYFKGLDALPFTGQYTHYSLDRETLPVTFPPLRSKTLLQQLRSLTCRSVSAMAPMLPLKSAQTTL